MPQIIDIPGTLPSAAGCIDALVKSIKQGVHSDELLKEALDTYPKQTVAMYLPVTAATQRCSGCKAWIFSKNAHSAYGGCQYICSRCRDRWYTYCEGCKSLRLVDDSSETHIHADLLGDMMQLNKLASYKANPVEMAPLPQFLKLRDERGSKLRYIGIEVEIEKRKDRPVPPDLIARSVMQFPNGSIIAKSDGSLSIDPDNPMKNGSNGWELCTMPGTLRYHLTNSGWQNFFKVMSPWVQLRPDTTGLHFHVNISSTTAMTIGKVSAWVNSECNQDLLRIIADRDPNQPSPTPPHKVYAKTIRLADDEGRRLQVRQVHTMKKHRKECPFASNWLPHRYYYYKAGMGFAFDGVGNPIIARIEDNAVVTYKCNCSPGSYLYKDHYAALNLLTGKPTFEFRFFRFSMNELHFFASLEFVDAIVNFCAQAGIKDLTTEAFIRWYEASYRRAYPHLTQWLVDKQVLTSRRRRD